MHYVKYNKWWGTKHFIESGKSFLDNGFYCPFERDTNAYNEYWDEQEYYIKNGSTYDGQRIAGMHYLYLNFCPIKDKKKKTMSFPEFWAMDAEYFLELEDVMGYRPSMTEDEKNYRPVVWSASKTRQCGASLKAGVPVLYNMNFVPFSANYIGAYLEKDAVKTLKMYLNYQDHCFKYTDFGKRFMEKDTGKYYKIGYYDVIDKEKIPAGYQSELSIITFQDNPEKGVGGSCDLFIIEESGMHPQLLQSVTYITPACKDGDYTTGNVLVYGAAGAEGQCDDLKKLHYSPRSYKAKAYPNKYDPKPIEEWCGYFVPNYACRKGHMDEDGNPNCESAIIARDKELEELKRTDTLKYLETLSQYPNNGTEMFGARGRKRFDTNIIDQQISLLKKHQVYGTPVELFEDIQTGRVRYKISDKNPIREWPTPKGTDLNGCVEIFEFPPSTPIDNLYIASIDSYNQDNSTTTSLGCIKIYKKINSISGEGTSRVLVAEYLARPTEAFGKHIFYQNCLLLLKLYNAIALPENEDQELTPWFYNNNADHFLADQPDIIRNIIPGSKVKRLKGIHATENLIIAAENKIARYLYEKLGTVYNDEGNPIENRLGVSRIPSIGLLQELREYTHESNKNFDRVRTFGWLLLYEDETQDQEAGQGQDESQDAIDFLVNTKRIMSSMPT